MKVKAALVFVLLTAATPCLFAQAGEIQDVVKCEIVEKGIEVFVVHSDTSKSLTATVELEGAVHEVLVDGSMIWVARGTKGLTLLDASDPTFPVEVATLEKGRDVVGVKKSGSVVMAVISSYDVTFIDVSDPKSPVVAGAGSLLGKTPPPAAAAEIAPVPSPAPAKAGKPQAKEEPELKVVIEGKVKKVKADWVILDVGSMHGVEMDMKFAVYSQAPVKKLDIGTGKYTKLPSGEKTAVVVIEQVQAEQSGGRLERGESADVGDLASYTTEAKKKSLVVPRGQFGFSRLQVTLRPFFGVGKLSFGMLNDLMIDHQFKLPVRIGFYVLPLGFAVDGSGTSFPTSLMAIAAYSSSYFEIGLGLGGTFSLHETKAGLTINQFIRLGSLEGLNIIASTSFVLSKTGGGGGSYDDEEQYEISFGQATGEINIPLHRRITLNITGGGGTNGFAFGTIGIRTTVWGNGGKGTLVIPAALGYSAVFDEECDWNTTAYDDICKGVDSHGPTFSIGIDYRF